MSDFLGVVPEGKVHGSLAIVPAPLARTKQTAIAPPVFLGAAEVTNGPIIPAPLAKHAVSEGTKALSSFGTIV